MACRRRMRVLDLSRHRRLFVLDERPLTAAELALRPTTRADCLSGPRPCPWVSCRHHLYLEVRPNGNLRLTWPGMEPEQLEHSCGLDVADRGAHTLEEVARILNLNDRRVLQLEQRAVRHLRKNSQAAGLS